MTRSTEELEENRYKSFYFLETNKNKIENTPFIPLLDSKESESRALDRFRQYDNLIHNIMIKIEEIIQQANNTIYQDLSKFVKHKHQKRHVSHLLIQPVSKIPVGYLLLTSNTANNSRILHEFYNVIKDAPVQLVTINNKQAANTLKAIIKVIGKQLESGLNADDKDRYSKQPYDIDFLSDWCTANKSKEILIVFEEADSIDLQALNQLLRMLCTKSSIQMKLIFGVNASNTGNWINNNINSEFRAYFQNYKFSTTNNETLFLNILGEIIFQQGLLIDNTSVDIILTRFYNSNKSVDAVINEIKVLLLIFYYSNSYSIFIEKKPTLKDITILRRLPSFKRYIELELYHNKLGSNNSSEIISLIRDDTAVLQKFNEIQAESMAFKKALKVLFHNIELKDRIEVYQLLLNGKKNHPTYHKYHNLFNSLSKFKFNGTSLFHEVFIVSVNPSTQTILTENSSNLMLDLLRPRIRDRLGKNLTDASPYLNQFDIQPIITKLFILLNEAPSTMNHYEFFMAFNQSLDKQKILKELRAQVKEEHLLHILDEVTNDEKEWNKMAYSWFLQVCHEFLMMGLIKEKPRGDHFEKNFWKSL